jgi:primosomal protein N' (replication factor Y)
MANERFEYVEVVLPLPLSTTFTYHIPQEMSTMPIGVGFRVIVPFGRKKFYTGVVVGLLPSPPEGFEIKELAMILDENPIIRHPQLKLWDWVADYYLCSTGDVYKAAVPAGMKIESETFVEVNPDFDFATFPLKTDLENEIYQLVEHEEQMTASEIAKKLDKRGTAATVTRLISRGVLIIAEKMVERYVTKKQGCVRLKPGLQPTEAFQLIGSARKQETLLLALIEMQRQASLPSTPPSARDIPKAKLLERAQVSAAILSAMEKKGIVEQYTVEINRFRYDGQPLSGLPKLSEPQQEALDKLHLLWKEKDVNLLHGVTSSGKTEIYIHIINHVLGRGDQVLYLVPEIALTAQLTRRLQQVFGERVVVYHSKFSDNERVDLWKKLLDSHEPLLILGVRSSVFLPFAKLGLVIVDEEHESSYKQYDPAPRYNARDVAMVLARFHGAKTLLGSATPSVETYYKALNGKFGLVTLSQRYQNVALPDIELVDLKLARNRKELNGAFAMHTVRRANESIQGGKQVILFQNRRGYAPMVRCKQCAWVPRCEHCDVSLTYHRALRQLQCHYCGAVYSLPSVCPQCKEPAIEEIGYGTERIEDELATLMPGVGVLRMDLDSTRNKHSYEQIIDAFSEGKASVLVGTQMVTKGLDFKNVEVVGILNADAVLNAPDFRSGERGFNMLEQVSGRAGRSDGNAGKVVVQTYNPAHPILHFVKHHDYLGFYQQEIAQREKHFYPPFVRVIYIYIKHRDLPTVRRLADNCAARLRHLLGGRVFGPEEPVVARVQNFYIRRIMLKIEVNASISKIKQLLRQTYLDLHGDPAMKQAILYYDVDPQ